MDIFIAKQLGIIFIGSLIIFITFRFPYKYDGNADETNEEDVLLKKALIFKYSMWVWVIRISFGILIARSVYLLLEQFWK